jgi:hypothetical protein
VEKQQLQPSDRQEQKMTPKSTKSGQLEDVEVAIQKLSNLKNFKYRGA